MAAGLVVPVSGAYIGLWNALALGTQNDNGFELQCTIQGQPIEQTDAYGMTLVEAIYRGQNWRVRLTGLEWKAGLLDSLQMFGQAATNTLSPLLVNIGDRWTKYCKTLLLVAILGFPPTAPASITALSAGIAPNSQSSQMLTSKVRELPLEYTLMPYSVTINSVTYNVPFTTT